MLFVHMAVVLNEIFFPKFDPFTNSLLSAFTFCSTFALKPIGALLFGYIGDKVGRKHTVIITTMGVIQEFRILSYSGILCMEVR
jgi:MFS family permease